MVKQCRALDEVPDLVVTDKQRLFQFRKEVSDQKFLKGKNAQQKHKRSQPQRLGQNHLRTFQSTRTGIWKDKGVSIYKENL